MVFTTDQLFGMAFMGVVTTRVLDHETGKVLQEEVVHNTVLKTGKAAFVRLLGQGLTETKFTALAIGTDNTAPADTQTALIAEISTGGGARGAATVSQETTTFTNDTLRFLKTWNFSSGFTINEVGILNNATSGGIMAGRALIGPVTVSNGNDLQVQYDLIAL